MKRLWIPWERVTAGFGGGYIDSQVIGCLTDESPRGFDPHAVPIGSADSRVATHEGETMQRIHSYVMSAVGGTLTALVFTASAAAPAMAGSGARTEPDVTTPAGPLSAVSAASSSDVWAVGYQIINRSGRTLVMHWNGTTWSSVPSPNPSTSDNRLSGVSAVSNNDAWAVGYDDVPAGDHQALILHWDGAQWAQVPSPDLGSGQSQLNAVSAVSATDAWAVGTYINTISDSETFVLHWDGSAWTLATSVSPASSNILAGIDADSSGDAWAVGYDGGATLTLHWNGTAWSKVGSPDPSNQVNRLAAVSATSASDAWAVGYDDRTKGPTNVTLILHWNGSTWSRVFSPSPGDDWNDLYGVSAVSRTDAWAVGAYQGLTRFGGPLVLHWNGTGWRRVSAPNPGSGAGDANILVGVSGVAPNDAWAVGTHDYISAGNRVRNVGLILHWNGTSWVRK